MPIDPVNAGGHSVPGLLRKKNVTILINEALSDAIDLGGVTLVGIQMPAAWTAAAITIAHNVGGTYQPVHDAAGTEVSITTAANRYVALDPTLYASLQDIKIRSGPVAAPVNQAAERTITLVLRPV